MRVRTLTVSVGLCGLVAGVLSANNFKAVQKSLNIPPSIASIVDANTSDLPEYILIQDIHRHPEVQANIAALLLHAHRAWGMTTAYLEGAYAGQAVAGVSTGLSLRARLEEGTLSGAEMAAAMAKGDDLRLVGIENAELYRDNVAAYQAAQEQQAQALQEIKTLRMVQRTLDFSRQLISKEQLERLELLARLKLKPGEYARYLAERETQPLSPQLAATLAGAERFYQLVDQRSLIFSQEALRQAGPGPKAFIVGGFHTAAMAAELRKAGKSFVVLSPHVTHSGYETLYAERMSETVSALNLR